MATQSRDVALIPHRPPRTGRFQSGDSPRSRFPLADRISLDPTLNVAIKRSPSAAANLARLWRDQGRRTEARDLAAPVYGWFTEGFDAADLKEAKALLAELA